MKPVEVTMHSKETIIRMIAGLVLFIVCSIPCSATMFTLTGGTSCVPVGSATDITIALSDVPRGLSGLNITVAIDDPKTAEIRNVTGPGWASMQVMSPLPADRVLFKTVDLDQKINPGDRDVPVCTVSIHALKDGNVILMISPTRVEDDAGGRYTVPSVNQTLCCGSPGKATQFSVPQTAVTFSPESPETAPSGIVTPTMAGTLQQTPLPSVPQPNVPTREAGALSTQQTPVALSPELKSTLVSTGTLPTTQTPLNACIPLLSLGLACLVFEWIRKTKEE
jgi:hypothetical protein